MLATRREIKEIVFLNLEELKKMNWHDAYDFVTKELSKVVKYKHFDAVVDEIGSKLNKQEKKCK